MLSRSQLVRALRQSLRKLQLSNSLLFLNKVLAVARNELRDTQTEVALSRLPHGAPPFVVHLIASVLLEVGRSNYPFSLDWGVFPQVLDLAFKLAIADSIRGSGDSEVHAYLIRMMSQQMDRHIPVQEYGLAIALFQDIDATDVTYPIDIRREVEVALGMPVETFMQMGQIVMAAPCAGHRGARLRGTLDLAYLSKAEHDLPGVPWLGRWLDFFRAIGSDQAGFNQNSRSGADNFNPYEMNPLRRRPLVQVEAARYIAVDPWLVAERTSLGIFYDVLDQYQDRRESGRFLKAFGVVFERVVLKLLQSAIPNGAIWRESNSQLAEQIKSGTGRSGHKIGDLAFRSAAYPVLIECTSMRPNLSLFTQASDADIAKATERIAEELLQASEHIAHIQSGSWSSESLMPGEWTALVVTLGRIQTVNSVFFRKKIDHELGERRPARYVILSLGELDSIIRLVENGNDFGEVVAKLAAKDSFDPLADQYRSVLQKCSFSSFSQTRYDGLFKFLPPIDASAEIR